MVNYIPFATRHHLLFNVRNCRLFVICGTSLENYLLIFWIYQDRAMEFNAYELLSKLRGGQPLPESNVGGPVVNPHAKHAQQTSVQVITSIQYI